MIHFDEDDKPVGRVLNRREVLALFGVASGALLVACGSSSSKPAAQAQGVSNDTAAVSATGATSAACVVRPELTEGPYFVDEKINRSDIRTDTSTGVMRDGTPLLLTFNVSDFAKCAGLYGAMVDVWHCDALGVYSDASDPGFSTKGQNFLRGYQVTDDSGKAQFTTIYPGWYQGRALHIHFKIRTTTPANQSYEFTSQLFFPDALTDQVHAKAPYAQKGKGRLLNAGDDIFRQSNGQLTLDATPSGDGYATTFNIALDLSDTKTGQPDGVGQGGPGGAGGPPAGGGQRGPGGPPPNGGFGGPPPGGAPSTLPPSAP